MGAELDEPNAKPSEWASAIWKYRGNEVPEHRPVTTGDVFIGKIEVARKGPSDHDRIYIVLQHPCTMRREGVLIRDGILAAVIKRDSRRLSSWPRDNTYNKMPLPELIPREEVEAVAEAGASADDNVAAVECWWAEFETLAIVNSEDLAPGKRIAVMDLEGAALLFQRFTHFLTRANVLIDKFATEIQGADTEVEILEEWIGRAIEHGVSSETAATECLEWLREETTGPSRQELLDDPLTRSRVVREALEESKRRY